MKLIIESGATKSTWVVTDKGKVVDKQVLDGINPTSNPSSVSTVKLYHIPDNTTFDSVHFYGAGVSSSVAIELLKGEIDGHLTSAQIQLEHDILAAARSVSAGKESIVSILGTGTNTVVYDGREIIQSYKALGFLFGDYGSGFHIGKVLIRKYYTKQMQSADLNLFNEKYISGKPDFLFRIYNSPRPNFETAKLSRFLNDCSPELKGEVLEETFSSFYKNQILPIENCKDYKLNFVGSISAHFETELRAKAADHGLEIDQVMSNPIDGLIKYHQNN